MTLDELHPINYPTVDLFEHSGSAPFIYMVWPGILSLVYT